jgi:hypothetical protein
MATATVPPPSPSFWSLVFCVVKTDWWLKGGNYFCIGTRFDNKYPYKKRMDCRPPSPPPPHDRGFMPPSPPNFLGLMSRLGPPHPHRISKSTEFLRYLLYYYSVNHKFLLNRREGDLESSRNIGLEVWSWAGEDPHCRYNSWNHFSRGAWMEPNLSFHFGIRNFFDIHVIINFLKNKSFLF